MGHLCCADEGVAVPTPAQPGRRAFPWLQLQAPGWELTCSSLCISASRPGGTACRPTSWRGRGLHSPEPRGLLPGFEKVFEASRPCRAPRPRSLSPPGSQACSLNMGGGWIECLGQVQQPESFLAEDGSAHQDHILDAGTEIWEG